MVDVVVVVELVAVVAVEVVVVALGKPLVTLLFSSKELYLMRRVIKMHIYSERLQKAVAVTAKKRLITILIRVPD